MHRAALLLTTLAAATAARAGEPRFSGEIEVRRALVEVRVVDRLGQPVAALAPGDFEVKVGGRRVAVEEARWVAASEEPAGDEEVPPTAAGEAGGKEPAPLPAATPAAGKRILLFFQTDLIPSRLTGLYRMAKRARELAAELAPGDRMAIAVLGSHLRLHLDFTGDVARLQRELQVTALLRGREVPEERGTSVSLLDGYDAAAARRACTPAAALRVLARAVEPVQGAKSLVFLGWGLGRLSGGKVDLGRDYGAAVAELRAARTTVFSLDLTDADYHSLEVGLQAVAEDTGGFYARTHLFPALAMRDLAGSLAGYYELTLEPPSLPPGSHSLEVRVRARGATVQAPTAIALGG